VIARLTRFFSIRIWEVRTKDLPPVRRFLFACLRVIVLALHRFYLDQCSHRASALTYYSLLSVVPAIAMVFGIAKGFGFDKLLEKQFMELGDRANWPPEVLEHLLTFAASMLEHVKGGLIAGLGVVVLLWAVISILGHAEEAFNAIWEAEKPRTFTRKLTDYLSIMIITPVLLIISSSITLVAVGEIKAIMTKIVLLGPLGPAIMLLMKALPYLFIWVLLALNYLILPNTRVRLKSSIIAAVAAGTVFQIVQWIYITFQVGAAKYGAIYGSFAALPLFLAWLYTSWMIVLFGAEIAVAQENGETYGFHPDYSKLNLTSRRVLALRVLHLIVKRFADEESPLSARQISATLKVPRRFVRRLLHELSVAKLLVETTVESDGEFAFEPAANIERLTIMHAVQTFEHWGMDLEGPARKDDDRRIAAHMNALSRAAEQCPENVRLKDI
jgi:membrane protein